MRHVFVISLVLALSAAAARAEVIQPDDKVPPKPPLIQQPGRSNTLPNPADTVKPIERLPLNVDEPDFKARVVFPDQQATNVEPETKPLKTQKKSTWALPQEEGITEAPGNEGEPAAEKELKEEFSPALAKAIAKDRSSKKSKDAVALYQEVVAAEPDNAEAHYRLGLALNRSGEIVSALNELEKALRLAPGSAKYQCDYGLVALSAGWIDKALVACQSAAVGAPSNARYQSALGDCLIAANRVNDASDAYSRAVHLDPNNAEYIHNLGVAYFHGKLFKKAIEVFTSAIKIKPENGLYYCSRGQAYGNYKSPKESIQDYMMAVRLDRNNAHAHFLLANALSDPEDPTFTSAVEAVELATRAVQLTQSKNAQYLMGLSRAYRVSYNYDAAIQNAKKAIVVDPREEYKKELIKLESLKNIGYK
jgi:tetratricopeptide (TPR) repeat protein